jgi:hypothetical protein
MGFSLFTVCSFTSSHQTRFYTLLALSLFASICWGSNPLDSLEISLSPPP